MPKSRAGLRTGPDYNQLDLFYEPTEQEQPDNRRTEQSHAGDERPHAAGTQDPQTLEQIPSEDGRLSESPQSASAIDLRGAGVDRESSLRTDGDPKDGLPDRLGALDEGVGLPSGRGGSAPTLVRSSEPGPEPTLARDFRITVGHRVGEGSLREKAKANLEAIRTLKKIESENRSATGDEKSALVKYTGWGALPGAFDPRSPREWQATAQQLQNLLSPEEYASCPRIYAERAFHITGSGSSNLAGYGTAWTEARCPYS